MRKPTHADAELLLHLYEIRREPELRQARRWLLTEFKSTTWAEVKSRYLSHVDEDRWFRMATSYWEMVATFVNRGAVHAELFFDHTGEEIATWDRIKHVIPDARADIRPTYLIQFEKLVAAHQAYRKKTTAQALARRGGAAAASGPRRRGRKSG
jgi:hypothetical protein